ncbi:MAG: LamG domain-containing protein [Gammaproteobacteria bacterium]|nr:LamG domain-containing protein [Gammaproteobacteria bacterium]
MNRLYLVIIISLTALIYGCGGGSGTQQNPDINSASLSYSGPPPATDDVRAFQTNVWENLKAQNRCGQCHGQDQDPTIVDPNDINTAYSQAVPTVNLADPSQSLMVTRVGGGHNCWLTSDIACADSIEQMIINWAGGSSSSTTRQIPLTAPVIKDPGDSKTFPVAHDDNAPNSFEDTVHPLLTAHCQECHDDSISLPISPFFANADPTTAYEAAKPKINIDTPDKSRLVVRLKEEFHNCWTNSCDNDAATMQSAIETFANAIALTAVDPDLVTSKALNLTDGIVASGGNRHESNLVAIWEFKAGSGATAFDTSGIEPAINLSLSGSYGWLSEFGIDLTGGKAQGDTNTSKKIHDFIRSTGEYSIETWAIPANVTQEDANIISYSAGAVRRNFTLGQALYNYDLYNRSNESDANGVEFLSTEDAGEILQSSLQHVVASYDPINGRSIYVNGELIDVTDPVTVSTSITDWDDTYAIVLGNEVSNNRIWNGKLRMVAIHNRILTAEQITQNFDVGVGEKFFLLFSVADQISIPDSYILFEVSLFDSYAYMFNKPTFINLDPDWTPVSIDIESMRIGINGKEAIAGQAYANLKTAVDPGLYTAQGGQLLSSLGTIISLEKGIDSDEFFLTFEKLGTNTNLFLDPAGVAPTPGPDGANVSDIGVRTFDEINASIAAITGISVSNPGVDSVYQQYRQQLPSVESIDAFLPSHQMAIAQLALTSCDVLVDTNPGFFGGFNFGAGAATAFNTVTKRNQILDPLLEAAANVYLTNATDNLTTQPAESLLRDMLGATTTLDLDAALSGDSYSSLMTEMQSCLPGCDTTTRTAEIVKAVCAAAVGSAVMLIQ